MSNKLLGHLTIVTVTITVWCNLAVVLAAHPDLICKIDGLHDEAPSIWQRCAYRGRHIGVQIRSVGKKGTITEVQVLSSKGKVVQRWKANATTGLVSRTEVPCESFSSLSPGEEILRAAQSADLLFESTILRSEQDFLNSLLPLKTTHQCTSFGLDSDEKGYDGWVKDACFGSNASPNGIQSAWSPDESLTLLWVTKDGLLDGPAMIIHNPSGTLVMVGEYQSGRLSCAYPTAEGLPFRTLTRE